MLPSRKVEAAHPLAAAVVAVPQRVAAVKRVVADVVVQAEQVARLAPRPLRAHPLAAVVDAAAAAADRQPVGPSS